MNAPANAPSPRIYVYDLPVAWRIGPQLLGEFDFALLERLLLSPHREADPYRADYFWVPGPNLQPAAKLAFVRRAWPFWNATVAQARTTGMPAARHILTLLGERGVGDSDLRPSPPARRTPTSLMAADSTMAAHNPNRSWLALTLNGMRDFSVSALARRATAARTAASQSVATGFELRRASTGFEPRGIGSMAGLPCHVCFQSGVDIVIPPPAATIDVPSCRELGNLTPTPVHATHRRARADRAWLRGTPATAPRAESSPAAQRGALLFWAGRVVPGAHRVNPMYVGQPNVRELLLQLSASPGFRIVNSVRGGRNASAPLSHAEAVQAMAGANFCAVPPGQRYGDARRHIVAAFLGCVPVFVVPDAEQTMAELLPWHRASLDLPAAALPQLPSKLHEVTPNRLNEMRQYLACMRSFLWYSSVYGVCSSQLAGKPDAFDGLMAILATRLLQRHVHSGDSGTLPATQLWRHACGVAATRHRGSRGGVN